MLITIIDISDKIIDIYKQSRLIFNIIKYKLKDFKMLIKSASWSKNSELEVSVQFESWNLFIIQI